MTAFPLRPFQAEDVNAIQQQGRNARHCALWHEPGLGKSLTAIAISEDRGYVGEAAAIICPAHLKLTWQAEWRKWKDDATCPVIASYHEAMHNPAILAHRLNVIVDEAHFLKRKDSQRAQAIVASLQRIESVLLLSGTAAPNGRPIELYTAASLLCFDRLRKIGVTNFEAYGRKFCGGVPGEWNGFRVSEVSTLNACFAGRAYRRRKADVLPELPPKIYRVIPFARPPEVETENLALVARVDANLGDGSGSGWLENESPETLLTMLAATEGMGAYSNLLRLFAEAKARAAAEYVADCVRDGEKRLVVFGHHTQLLLTIRDACVATGATVGLLTGSVSQAVRQGAVDFFQSGVSGGAVVLVCQYDAAGTGYTFTAADHCILAESPWTPGAEDQGVDRLHRIGQLGTVLVDCLCVAGTLDEWRMRHVARKRDRVALLEGRAVVRQSGPNLDLLGDLHA